MATSSVSRPPTASEALACGALSAGVQFVTGYPGSPSTETLEALLQLAPHSVCVEWAINEKSAFDAAFGASLVGARSLLCLKSVGLNVALDSLMVANLAAGPGGFVILTGDDPGGWGSQNEQDSRPLAAAAEVPLLEPTGPLEAASVMRTAFELSERHQLPVVVRITRAFAAMRCQEWPSSLAGRATPAASFDRTPDRYNVLPIHVVTMHRRLQAALGAIRGDFERSSMVGCEGTGRTGLIAAGHLYTKLAEILDAGQMAALQVLRLAALHPLPEQRIVGFLRSLDRVLVLEETAPYVEAQVQAMAQRAGLMLPIMGRASGHLPGAGELAAPHIVSALSQLLPEALWPSIDCTAREMPSRQPLCDACPYRPALDALLDAMQRLGGREAFVVTGETGCMVRAQLPPWRILDAKYAMGSSIGLALGMARGGLGLRLVALSGDSALLHSGLGELIDAVQAGIRLLVLLLANQTTALSGGQPHPATDRDSHGRPRSAVSLDALARAAGAAWVRVVDPADMAATRAAIGEALEVPGVAVVIAQRACPVVGS